MRFAILALLQVSWWCDCANDWLRSHRVEMLVTAGLVAVMTVGMIWWWAR